MPTYTPQVIEELRGAADLVSVVSQHVVLKRVGKNMVGLCPFHKEKTPSFHVNAQKQFYKCYGCGEGGDVISFVRKVSGLGFPEAVRQLAQQFRVVLPEGETDRRDQERQPLYKLNAWAVGHFQENLKEPGNPGMAYLLSRGLTPDSVERFRLGYAREGWDGCLTAARSAGFAEPLLEQAGLVVRSREGQGLYDRFRGRVVFPIFDTQNRPIGFGARTLAERPGEPKYLNSPATPVFAKGSALYGLEQAATSIRDEGRVAVMEGYTDVIRAHQAGVGWAVATLGTALTADHARLLRRATDQVVLVYDADAAGKKAADRGLDVFLQANFLVRVLTLPEGEDPCDYFAHADAASFTALLAGAEELVDYRISQARLQGRFATVKEQADVLKEILATVAGVPDPAQRELMVKRVSERTGVSEGALLSRLEGGAKPVRPAPATGAPSAPRREAAALEVLEVALLSVLLRSPGTALAEEGLSRVRELVLENPVLSAPFRAAFHEGIRLLSEASLLDPQRLMAAMGSDEDAKRLLVSAQDDKTPAGEEARTWDDCLDRLERRQIREESGALRGRVAEDPEAFRKFVETKQRERRVGRRPEPLPSVNVHT